LVEKDILKWLVPHFVNHPRTGAVTGNPMVRNRVNILTRVQTAEYSSIISLIKRAQRLVGKIFTVSGAVSAVSRIALIDIGLYDPTIATEDIDISWRLQKRFWDVRFEAKAVVWLNCPTTLKTLFKQRRRWAFGGLQVLIKHRDVLKSWRQRRFWPIYIDNLLALFWALSFFILVFIWLIGLFFKLPLLLALGASPLIQWYGSILALTSLLQLAVSAWLNFNYDRTLIFGFFWAAWYPVFYWLITSFAAIIALLYLLKGTQVQKMWQS
jgi:biofilm PGA synthesis N-glycosyltransferase PgaC